MSRDSNRAEGGWGSACATRGTGPWHTRSLSSGEVAGRPVGRSGEMTELIETEMVK